MNERIIKIEVIMMKIVIIRIYGLTNAFHDQIEKTNKKKKKVY